MLWDGDQIGHRVWRQVTVPPDLAQSFCAICVHYHCRVIHRTLTYMRARFNSMRERQLTLNEIAWPASGLSYEKIRRYNNSPPCMMVRWPPQQIPPSNFLGFDTKPSGYFTVKLFENNLTLSNDRCFALLIMYACDNDFEIVDWSLKTKMVLKLNYVHKFNCTRSMKGKLG